MKPETVLKKAIEKAIKGGWKESAEAMEALADDYTSPPHESSYYWIFSHNFAKSFWPGNSCFHDHKQPFRHDVCKKGIYAWQYHLQQLVLAKDRLKYLEQFLRKKV